MQETSAEPAVLVLIWKVLPDASMVMGNGAKDIFGSSASADVSRESCLNSTLDMGVGK